MMNFSFVLNWQCDGCCVDDDDDATIKCITCIFRRLITLYSNFTTLHIKRADASDICFVCCVSNSSRASCCVALSKTPAVFNVHLHEMW